MLQQGILKSKNNALVLIAVMKGLRPRKTQRAG